MNAILLAALLLALAPRGAEPQTVDLKNYGTATVVGDTLVLAGPGRELLMVNVADVRPDGSVLVADALVMVTENGEYVFSWVDEQGVTCTFRQPCVGLTQEECWKRAKAGRLLMQREFKPKVS